MDGKLFRQKAFCFIRSLKSFIFVVLFRDFSVFSHAGAWIKSRQFGRDSLTEKTPLISFRAREWLDGNLKPDMAVFEYGSGGSTVFIAQRVRKIISVEHKRDWYQRASRFLAAQGISNCEYLLCEPENLSSGTSVRYSYQSYTSFKAEGFGFRAYVKSIEKYPDKSFDLVFIDGRARASCIFHALPKIKPGGYLLLDNAEREIYQDTISSLLHPYERIDFYGVGPFSTRASKTSAWRIK